MSTAWAICRRDLVSHFTSPLAWLVLFAWTLITGGIFYAELSATHAVGLSPVPLFDRSLHWGSWLLILLAPAITMSSFAAERAQGSMQLLLSLPITETQLLLGKFLAGFGMLVALIVATLPQVAVLFFISEVPAGQLATGYLGLVLIAALYAAIGTWISSLVDSTITAYVLSMGLILILVLGGAVLSNPYSGIWTPVAHTAAFMGIEPRLQNFRAGILSFGDTIWFLGMIFASLSLGRAALLARRQHG